MLTSGQADSLASLNRRPRRVVWPAATPLDVAGCAEPGPCSRTTDSGRSSGSEALCSLGLLLGQPEPGHPAAHRRTASMRTWLVLRDRGTSSPHRRSGAWPAGRGRWATVPATCAQDLEAIRLVWSTPAVTAGVLARESCPGLPLSALSPLWFGPAKQGGSSISAVHTDRMAHPV